MYKEIDADTVRNILNVEDNYSVDTLITYGAHPKQSTEAVFHQCVQELFPQSEEEPAFTGFFQDIKSYRFNDKRLWFCVVYGGAMTSEVVHIAALLDAQKILHAGSCGALDPTLQIGRLFIPESSTADESCTRMYQQNETNLYTGNTNLSRRIQSYLQNPANSGPMISIQAMLAETRDDIKNWSRAGYKAVDLETATVFAVASHFKIPAAALLYVSDNLVTEDLVHLANEEQRVTKLKAKKCVLTTLIQTACM